jgi:lipase chaperone LimK
VPEEGLAQLNAMQALRVSHLGAEAARQLYGEDDAVARRLLELMRDETDTSLSMEQKAMRAQARYDLERGAVRR